MSRTPLRVTEPSLRRREALTVFLVAIALTLVAAAPVLVAPATRLYGNEIVGRYHDAYTVISQFRSGRHAGVYFQPATDALGALVAHAIGAVPAFNLIILVTFPLAALTTFLLARHLGLGRAGATLAALAYAFSPFHLAQAAYHPHIAQVQWLPLYFLSLALCLERLSAWRLTLLAAATALTALSNFYFGFIAAVLTPVAVGALAWRARATRGALAGTLAALAAMAAAGLAAIRLTAPTLWQSPADYAFPRADLFRYSARWWSFFVPPIDHAVLGHSVGEFWRGQDVGDEVLAQQLTLGWGFLALSAVAVAAWWRRRCGERAVPVLLAIAAAALLCSLSPERLIFGIDVLRPSALLYEIAPMFRAYARFGVVLGLAVTLLAGLGFDALRAQGGRARLAAGALVALGAFECAPFPPWRWHDVLPEAHRWLAGRTDVSVVYDCSPYRDAATFASVRQLAPFAIVSWRECREPDFVAMLAARRVSHLVLAGAPGALSGLRELKRLADTSVYAVTAPPPQVYAVLSNFYPREERDGASFRWMGAAGGMVVENAAGSPLFVALELDLRAFPASREVEIEVAGEFSARWMVGSSSTVLEWLLPPGKHRLRFLPSGRPAVPHDLLGNDDFRPLTIAVHGWKLRVLRQDG